ncbi:MAG: hypothetical protein V7744_18520 [Pseudomonadales bacterium]
MKNVLIILSFVAVLLGCVNPNMPVSSVNEADLEGAHKAVEAFQEVEALLPYFKDAVAYAVYPVVVRGGAGVGAAYGSGWSFRQDTVDGKTRVFQVDIGPQLILESYRHIIFFQTEKAYQSFQHNKAEFSGQFNIALVTIGTSITPAYNQEVAAFSQLHVGAGIEASVGAHSYTFTPVKN